MSVVINVRLSIELKHRVLFDFLVALFGPTPEPQSATQIEAELLVEHSHIPLVVEENETLWSRVEVVAAVLHLSLQLRDLSLQSLTVNGLLTEEPPSLINNQILFSALIFWILVKVVLEKTGLAQVDECFFCLELE